MQRYKLTKKQYNYLLPVKAISNKFLVVRDAGEDKHYFIGTLSEYKDLLNRCKYLD